MMFAIKKTCIFRQTTVVMKMLGVPAFICARQELKFYEVNKSIKINKFAMGKYTDNSDEYKK